VPDEVERCATWIGRLGSEADGFRALIAGSFQFVILLEKIFAIVAASRFSAVTPGTLKTTAIGEM
jgi:hypothetical protein